MWSVLRERDKIQPGTTLRTGTQNAGRHRWARKFCVGQVVRTHALDSTSWALGVVVGFEPY